MAKTDKRLLGDIGEGVACTFLVKRGFTIVEQNYLRKWGEIDIVARKGDKVHFIEVKSLSADVSHGTSGREVTHGTYRPEDNMHPGKVRRLLRTIQTYLLHKKLDCDWQLDLVTVRIDTKTRLARTELIENIIL
jgi:putative endonuclease